MDAALATFAHFTISARTSAANCSGVLETGSTPSSSRRLLVAGLLTILHERFVEVRHDLLRRRGRREDAVPGADVEAGQARFVGGRQLRKQRMALERAHRERFEPARFDERNRGWHGLEHEVRFAAHDCGHRLAAALVRDVDHFGARHQVEELRGHVIEAAAAGGRIAEALGLGFRELDELLDRVRGDRRMDEQQVRAVRHEADRRESPSPDRTASFE